MKMQTTVIISQDYLHYIQNYDGFQKHHKIVSMHLSPFQGCTHRDIVIVGDCWPLSKTVHFNVLKVTQAAGTKKQFQKF
ncbi:40S ribosomal protein S11 [Cricetulus griseus]|uniref:40S ribosomal protein S11 n=1 Tax=Cricetulus griseus TaxID=10029 RepID=G3I8I1_CRIGR|nr:40S ribosomal protein S11 [Cricetulus griseus]